jgi:hypothetical protein
VPRVPGSILGPGGISEIYLSIIRTVSWRGVDFKLCLRIDVWVAALRVLVAVGRSLNGGTRTHSRRTIDCTHRTHTDKSSTCGLT